MTTGIAAAIVVGLTGVFLPAPSPAASVVLSYDTIQVFTGPNATGTSTTMAAGMTAFTVPAGGSMRFNVRATVVGNPGPVGTAYTDVAQPTALGLGAFGAYVTNSNPTMVRARTSTGTASTALVNGLFASVSSAGTVANGTVGDPASPASFIAGGTNSAAVSAADAGSIPRFTVGASTTASQNLLFRQVGFNMVGPGIVTTLTTILPTTSLSFVTLATPGDANTPPTYTNRNFNSATDTLTGLSPLVIPGPEPTCLSVLGTLGAGLLARRRASQGH